MSDVFQNMSDIFSGSPFAWFRVPKTCPTEMSVFPLPGVLKMHPNGQRIIAETSNIRAPHRRPSKRADDFIIFNQRPARKQPANTENYYFCIGKDRQRQNSVKT